MDALSSFNSINFLHPKISMHILHTVLCTSEMVLTRKLCRTVKSFLSRWSSSVFSQPYCLIQWWSCIERLDASHSQGLYKESNTCVVDLLAHRLAWWTELIVVWDLNLTGPFCFVLQPVTVLSQCLSLPRSINGYFSPVMEMTGYFVSNHLYSWKERRTVWLIYLSQD